MSGSFHSSLLEIDTHSHMWITHLHSDHRWRNEKNTENVLFVCKQTESANRSTFFFLSNFSLFSNSVRTSSTLNEIQFQHNNTNMEWESTNASISKQNSNHKSEHSISTFIKCCDWMFLFWFLLLNTIDGLVHDYICFVGAHTHRQPPSLE